MPKRVLARSVVGRLLVIGERDLFAERLRHGGAVRGDIRQMAARQPQLGDRGQRERGEKNRGELRSGHSGIQGWN